MGENSRIYNSLSTKEDDVNITIWLRVATRVPAKMDWKHKNLSRSVSRVCRIWTNREDVARTAGVVIGVSIEVAVEECIFTCHNLSPF